MKFLRNKNAPPTAGLVQEFIDTAYDIVKSVHDNLDLIIIVGNAIENGDLDSYLADTDINTLVKLNAIVADATLLDEATLGTAAYVAITTFATAAQGITADSALQPADLDTLAKLNALVLDQTVASEAYVDLAVSGLYDHKGGYDAATNTPDLDTSPTGVKKADAYTVSVAGNFFTVPVDAGDILIADKDDPTLETDWTIANRNIDESAFATAAQGAKADTALQPGEAATPAQGTLADSAVQPSDNISVLTNDSGFTDDQTGAEIKTLYELEADTNAFTDTEKSKLTGIEPSAKDDQSDVEITTAYNTQTPVVAQAAAEAGTSTTAERWTPERVKQAIDALGGAGGGGGGMLALYKSAGYTLVADDLVYSEPGLSHLLPATPTDGDKCSVWDAGDNAGNNAINIDGNGETITSLGTDVADTDIDINMSGGRFDFVYVDSLSTWIYSYVVQTIQPDTTIVKTVRKIVYPEAGMSKSSTTLSSRVFLNNVYEADVYAFTSGVLSAYANIAFPPNWDGGLVRMRMVWSPDTTNVGTCIWWVRWFAMADGETPGDTPYVEAITTDTSLGVVDDIQFTPWTPYINIAGDGEDLFSARVIRPGTADTFTGTAYFIGMQYEFTTEETLTAAVSNSPSNAKKIISGTTHTLVEADNGYELIFTNAAAIAVTVPDGLSEDFQCVGTQTTAAGIPTFTPATDLINGAGTGVAPSAQWKGMHLGKYTATDWIAKF